MMKSPEKKIETYTNPEHSDIDIQKQMQDIKDKILKSLELPDILAANERVEVRAPIGKCMGEDIYPENLHYDAALNVYHVQLKDGTIVDVNPSMIQFDNTTPVSKSYVDSNIVNNTYEPVIRVRDVFINPMALSITVAYTDGTSETYDEIMNPKARDIMVGMTKQEAKDLVAGGRSSSQSIDPLRARVEAGGWRLDGRGAQSASSRTYVDYGKASVSQPWADPLAESVSKARDRIACCDMPELRPDVDPNAKIEVYYHDRYPNIGVRQLIEQAVNVLKDRKKLNISIHSISKEGTDWRLIYKVISDNMAPDIKQGKLVECIFSKKCFERTSHDLDHKAGLKAELDTNDYIRLRIAYLIFQAQKLGKRDAHLVNFDIFKVLGIDVKPIFTW